MKVRHKRSFLTRLLAAEALQNVTPTNLYLERWEATLSRRERIKRATLKRRKRLNRRTA